MLVILLNCVTLGMFQPCEDVSCQSEWCRILQVGAPLAPLWPCRVHLSPSRMKYGQMTVWDFFKVSYTCCHQQPEEC